MTDRFQRVEPTPFDAREPSSDTTENTPTAGHDAAAPGERSPLLIPGLAGLAVLALVVVFLLPELVKTEPDPSASVPTQTRKPETRQPEAAGGSSRASTQDSAPASSPFADAVEARARAEAQDLLAELLDVQKNLEERGAVDWAPELFASIAAEALTGDEQYRERNFEAAIETYGSALDQALALEQSIPGRVDALLEETRAAIETLEPDAATQALALAGRMDPLHADLDSLEQRVEGLPTVIEQVERGQTAEASADLATAVSAWQDAADLDGDHQFVAAELKRVQAELLEERFNAAMSEGYAALDDDRFDRATARFEAAGTLKSGSAEAATALQEVSVARTAARLRSLQSQGEELVAGEDWEEAAKVFEEALKVDPSLRFAREGLSLARPRSQLDAALTTILDKPERLVDAAILREAQNTLDEAADIADPGARLSRQLREARETLRIASTPIPVTIQSDGETSIIVYKVARLGAVETQELQLRPGTYTAVGTRRGFRDKRVEFTVTPAGLAPVYIACSETI